MLRSLSAILITIALIVGTSMASAQECPPGTIGVYFDTQGNSMSTSPVQHQDLYMFVILFAEAPVGGAAWALEMTSPQYEGELVGPAGPNCQPPWCTYQDPPFWYMGMVPNGTVVLGNPFEGGVRQGFGDCISGFFGFPILLATVILRPWADILESIEVDITVVEGDYEGLVYALCDAHLCFTVTGLTSHLGATVVASEAESWGAVKALYR